MQSGTMPVLRLTLQILAIGLAKTFMPFSKTSVEIPSVPIALVLFKFLTILVISPAVTNRKLKVFFEEFLKCRRSIVKK